MLFLQAFLLSYIKPDIKISNKHNLQKYELADHVLLSLIEHLLILFITKPQ